jgi:GT2 family glycosyltransferase
MEHIHFVFTNYNNSKFTENAIKSIQEFDNGLIQIVVVDNKSDEDDIKALKQFESKYSNLSIVYSKDNLGYFRGLNVGIHYLKEKFPHTNAYMVIGNNDVLFPKDFYQSIINKKDLLEKYPVISPNIITADGFNQNPHVISKISKTREIIYDIYHTNYIFAKLIIQLAKITSSFTDRKDEEQHEVAQEIYQGYGAIYILTPLFFENFKDLWAPTFLMYEEYFLSKQLSDKGYKIYYEPSIKLTHLMHATTDKLPGKLKWQFSKKAHKEYRKYVKIR